MSIFGIFRSSPVISLSQRAMEDIKNYGGKIRENLIVARSSSEGNGRKICSKIDKADKYASELIRNAKDGCIKDKHLGKLNGSLQEMFKCVGNPFINDKLIEVKNYQAWINESVNASKLPTVLGRSPVPSDAMMY